MKMIDIASNNKIATFDVFNTAITRIAADLKGIFNIVSKEVQGRGVDVSTPFVKGLG